MTSTAYCGDVADKDVSDGRSGKRPRLEKGKESVVEPQIPVLEVNTMSENSSNGRDFWDTFDTYKVIHLPQTLQGKENKKNQLNWRSLRDLFESLQETDQESWCIENAKSDRDKNISAQNFLQPDTDTQHCGYCSFLVQNDKKVMKQTLDRLPICDLPFTNKVSSWTYGPCLWFFFGRNSGESALEGRPEHTDSVSHDGTWHYQLSGCKKWYLRPTTLLLEQLQGRLDENQLRKISCESCVTCQEGDVLVVNTRLWWHRTVIPPQSVPSVSYARDFFVQSAATSDTQENGSDIHTMTNVDGLYAANDIEQGTVVFTEKDMPNCELHRSTTNPNCEIVQLEDGSGAIVSCRDIAAGEFFCVPESSDDDGEYGEEESDDEDD